MLPSYILCRDVKRREYYTLFESLNEFIPKSVMLYKSMNGHDDIISKIKTLHKHNKNDCVFWFPCNAYLERAGPAVLVSRVDEKLLQIRLSVISKDDQLFYLRQSQHPNHYYSKLK